MKDDDTPSMGGTDIVERMKAVSGVFKTQLGREVARAGLSLKASMINSEFSGIDEEKINAVLGGLRGSGKDPATAKRELLAGLRALLPEDTRLTDEQIFTWAVDRLASEAGWVD